MLEGAIAGLRKLPVDLVVTVGPGVDPARFGPQPAHVLLEPYVAHALPLPHCHLVASQGGAGILFGALSHGLPQLVMPQPRSGCSPIATSTAAHARPAAKDQAFRTFTE